MLELLPSGDRFLIRAGVGWNPQVVGKATIEAGAASPAGYALLTGKPVACEDLLTDRRFKSPEVLREQSALMLHEPPCQLDQFGIMSWSLAEWTSIEPSASRTCWRDHDGCVPELQHGQSDDADRDPDPSRRHVKCPRNELGRIIEPGSTPREKTVDLDLQCVPMQVHLDRSAPLGLLTAEFILNSIKHAFPEGRGRVSVHLDRVDEKTASLVLADNGTGLAQDMRQGSGSGLRLIEQLAQQAEASLSWRTSPGTCLELRFGGVAVPQLDGMHILVVEDEALIAIDIEAQLRLLGASSSGRKGASTRRWSWPARCLWMGRLLDVNIMAASSFR